MVYLRPDLRIWFCPVRYICSGQANASGRELVFDQRVQPGDLSRPLSLPLLLLDTISFASQFPSPMD